MRSPSLKHIHSINTINHCRPNESFSTRGNFGFPNPLGREIQAKVMGRNQSMK